jgi:uncharacterized protein
MRVLAQEPWTATSDGVVIDVRLTPRGGRDAIEGTGRRADGRPVVKARVRAAPSDGEANTALCRLIGGAIGVLPRDVTIAAGVTSRVKRIRSGAKPQPSSRRCDIWWRSTPEHGLSVSFAAGVQLCQPKATLSSTRVPNFSDERATVLPLSAR